MWQQNTSSRARKNTTAQVLAMAGCWPQIATEYRPITDEELMSRWSRRTGHEQSGDIDKTESSCLVPSRGFSNVGSALVCFASTAAVVRLRKTLASSCSATGYLRPEAGFAKDGDNEVMNISLRHRFTDIEPTVLLSKINNRLNCFVPRR